MANSRKEKQSFQLFVSLEDLLWSLAKYNFYTQIQENLDSEKGCSRVGKFKHQLISEVSQSFLDSNIVVSSEGGY